MKFLLATKSGIDTLDFDSLDEAGYYLTNLKYPAGFISLTIIDNVEGPY